MKSINVEIGNRLKEFRKDLNLSQSQFGRKLNISQSLYSRIERGHITLNPLEMYDLYDQFQISFDWLIMGKGEKLKTPSSKA